MQQMNPTEKSTARARGCPTRTQSPASRAVVYGAGLESFDSLL
jgi:hypothetical protein